MTITPSTIYWIGNCDSIVTACIFLTVISALFGLAGFCATMEARCEKAAIIIALICAPTFLIGIAGAVFVPSSKTAAAMYVVPAIVNNEKIQAVGNEIYGFAVEWLNELKPKASNKNTNNTTEHKERELK